jgi:hypothetical protein
MENNQTIHFRRRLADDDDEEGEISGLPPLDPMHIFKDRDLWKPPQASTPVHFSDLRMDKGDEFADQVITQVIASPRQVTLCLDKHASVERVIKVFQ